MQHRGLGIALAILIATTVSAAALQPAFADTWKQDQSAANGTQPQVALTVAAGTSVTVPDAIVIEYGGRPHLGPGSVVTFSLDAQGSKLPAGATMAPVRITIPAPWIP